MRHVPDNERSNEELEIEKDTRVYQCQRAKSSIWTAWIGFSCSVLAIAAGVFFAWLSAQMIQQDRTSEYRSGNWFMDEGFSLFMGGAGLLLLAIGLWMCWSTVGAVLSGQVAWRSYAQRIDQIDEELARRTAMMPPGW